MLDGAESAYAEPCTVHRWCSSVGVVCDAGDRDCVNQATGRGFEVVCETRGGAQMVYCPGEAARADSGVVWIMLAVAAALGLVGGALSWVVFRKKL